MFNPPTLLASTFPEGFVAPGRDSHLYIVTPQRTWILYRKSTIVHAKLCLDDSDASDDIDSIENTSIHTLRTYVAEYVIKPPSYCEEELPYPQSPPHSHSDNYVNSNCVTIYDTLEKPVKRGRGRPRTKCVNIKRTGRAPTEYNKFVKRRMHELADQELAQYVDEDAVMKLDRIAKEWQEYKKLVAAGGGNL